MGGRLYLAAHRKAQPAQSDTSRCVALNIFGGWSPSGPCFPHVCPQSLVAVLHFSQVLSDTVLKFPTHDAFVCYIDSREPAKLMHARFLMASFLVLVEQHSAYDAFQRVCGFDPLAEDPYLRAGCDELVSVLDGLEALSHAKCMGLMQRLLDSDTLRAEVAHYANPLEGGCDWIVPDELMVLRCPTSMSDPTATYIDVQNRRYFSSNFFVEPFILMNISTVVSLSKSKYTQYTTSTFEAAGICCVNLECEEQGEPPIGFAQEFLGIMDRSESIGGAVAIHCRTGLGLSGFYSAIWLIRTHRFSVHAAIAWLRLVRPGCLTAEHEAFLRAVTSESKPEDRVSDSEAASGETARHCVLQKKHRRASRGRTAASNHRVRPESSLALLPEGPEPRHRESDESESS